MNIYIKTTLIILLMVISAVATAINPPIPDNLPECTPEQIAQGRIENCSMTQGRDVSTNAANGTFSLFLVMIANGVTLITLPSVRTIYANEIAVKGALIIQPQGPTVQLEEVYLENMQEVQTLIVRNIHREVTLIADPDYNVRIQNFAVNYNQATDQLRLNLRNFVQIDHLALNHYPVNLAETLALGRIRNGVIRLDLTMVPVGELTPVRIAELAQLRIDRIDFPDGVDFREVLPEQFAQLLAQHTITINHGYALLNPELHLENMGHTGLLNAQLFRNLAQLYRTHNMQIYLPTGFNFDALQLDRTALVQLFRDGHRWFGTNITLPEDMHELFLTHAILPGAMMPRNMFGFWGFHADFTGANWARVENANNAVFAHATLTNVNTDAITTYNPDTNRREIYMLNLDTAQVTFNMNRRIVLRALEGHEVQMRGTIYNIGLVEANVDELLLQQIQDAVAQQILLSRSVATHLVAIGITMMLVRCIYNPSP